VDRGRLRRVGQAYADPFLDVAIDIFVSFIFLRYGIAPLYPVVDLRTERATLRRRAS
jgi:hypothetical protein